jgi:hypothetical protein
MRVSTYAEVYSPRTHPHIAEHRPRERPVQTLGELVEEYGGYTFTSPVSAALAKWIGRLAEATGDTALAAVVARGYAKGSFEHLRHLDHTSTRVVYGLRVEREPTDPPDLLPPPDPGFVSPEA